MLEGQEELIEGIPRIDLVTIHLMYANKVSEEVIYAYRKKLHNMWKGIGGSKLVTSMKNDISYKYRIESSIPNYAEIILALQKKRFVSRCGRSTIKILIDVIM